MENLSAEQEERPRAALADKVDNTNLFDREEAEHFRLPCTATKPTGMDNDQVCPINDYLPVCNELLFDIRIELREQRGGSLSLVCFRSGEPKVVPSRDADLRRSSTFLR
ncbi:hypothetical protein MTO96_015959 [Rhipicephalus appendiculatus]